MTSFVNNMSSEAWSNASMVNETNSDDVDDDYVYEYTLVFPDYWDEFIDMLYRWLIPLMRIKPALDKIVEICDARSPLSLVLSSLGSVTNLINLLVFYRQGVLRDSCTTSLFGLACSDFFFCFIQCIESLGITITKLIGRVEMEFNYFVYVTCVKEFVFQYLSAWITAFISVERMVGVAFPFKSKTIFTPKRSICVLFLMFLALFLLNTPRLLYLKLGWHAYPHVNISYGLHHVYSGIISDNVYIVMEEVMEAYLRPLCVFVVMIGNVIIITKVTVSKQFRKTATSSSKTSSSLVDPSPKQTVKTETRLVVAKNHLSKSNAKTTTSEKSKNKISDNKTRKELKLIRMMIVLCLTFFLSHILNIVAKLIRTVAHYSYGHVGREYLFFFRDFVDSLTTIGFTLETLNAATNIVIYYTMSSRYRKKLKEMSRVHKN